MSREERSLDLTPDAIVYPVNRTAHLFLLLVWLSAICCGVLLLDTDRITGWAVIGIFFVLAATKLVDLLSGSMGLALNRDGFVLRRFYLSQTVRWSEVAEPFNAQVGAQSAIGYICSDLNRKYSLSRWYHRALFGMDGWIVVWKFRPQPLSIAGAMHLFWRRARADLKLRYWQPDVLVFEGNTILAWVFLVFCGWMSYTGVSIGLSLGWISPRAWFIAIATAVLAIMMFLTLIPGAFGLTLMLDGFELRWFWRRRLVKWRDVEKPLAINGPWRGIVCRFRPGVKRKFGWLDYYRKDVGIYSNPDVIQNHDVVKIRHVPRGPLLKFMTDFWERAQADPARTS